MEVNRPEWIFKLWNIRPLWMWRENEKGVKGESTDLHLDSQQRSIL